MTTKYNLVQEGEGADAKPLQSSGPEKSTPKSHLLCFILFILAVLFGGVYYSTDYQYVSGVFLPKVTVAKINGLKLKFIGDYRFDVNAVLSEVEKLDNMLTEYYGPEILSKIRTKSYGTSLETNSSKRGIEYMARNVVRQLLEGGNFVIGMIGSSVAAAHDNCHYDGYDMQTQRLLSPIWKAAGSDLEFRNAGEGGSCGDSHRDQVYCIEHMVGRDIDLLTYSWTYFESRERGYKEHEKVLRWALMMDKAPATVLMSAGHGNKGDKHPCYNDGNNQRLFKLYGARFGFQAVCLQGALYQIPGYSGKHWGQVGDGLHNITRYGDQDPSLGAERKKSLGVVWRNWHPGPLGFQIASDGFAYLHISAVRHALKIIAAKSNDLNRAPLFSDFVEFNEPMKLSSLPSPLFIDNVEGSLDTPPACLNLQRPTFGNSSVSIVPPEDKNNPYANTELESATGSWKYKIKDSDSHRLIPKAEKGRPECIHLDACGMMYADSTAQGWLVSKLPKMKFGRIMLCFMGTNQGAFSSDSAVEVTLNKELLPSHNFKTYPVKSNCLKVLDRLPENKLASMEESYLGIRITNSSRIKKIQVTHIIAI